MTICTVCHHKNMPGAVFCEECGSALLSDDTLNTQNISKSTRDISVGDVPAQRVVGWATLHILASGQLIPLAERSEFTLGRLSEGQPIVPDLDLGPYQAYSLGVSRIHALIKRNAKGQVQVMDLNSSNGTYLNGQRLPPNQPVVISHGDVVSLGKLKIQILIA